MTVPAILVVDDERDMRKALSHALRRCGFRVEASASGSEALARFDAEKFDLVITDMKMPEMSGIELLSALKAISSRIPVIMITAYGTIHNAVEAMQAGASDYLLKPFSYEILEKTVKRVIDTANGSGQGTPVDMNDDGGLVTKQMITQDPKLRNILKLAQSVAPSSATVLIQGESGTGKELLAHIIHQYSGQPKAPYVALNCAALPDTLAESELFGHEKGAFTGATSRKIGKFELAKNGTIVLDEISEMAKSLQAKLLRVLQEREIDRVGGGRPVPIAARVVAISNVDLKQAVAEGKFREDLFYRINVVPLTIPPLRERKGDIPLLAQYFLQKYSALNNKPLPRLADETLAVMQNYTWKGNVRELENSIERAVLVGNGDTVLPEHLILGETPKDGPCDQGLTIQAGVSVKEMEKELILSTLKEVEDNRTRAAELLGISIRTLRNKLREYKTQQAGTVV